MPKYGFPQILNVKKKIKRILTFVQMNDCRHVRACVCICVLSGFLCEEHDNPADFFLDVIIQCQNLTGTGHKVIKGEE